MTLFDAFSYRNKRALVVGGATGMGAAVAELVRDAGAEVVVMDRAKVTLKGVRSIAIDLADKASIDKALASTCCSAAPALPTARPASSGSTSSATAT